MANIVGKWKISQSENFADFLTACGASAERVELAQKVENSATTEFYYDGNTIGRRIFKADGSLFVDKSAVVGETKEDASMVDNSSVQVTITVVDDNTVVREEHGATYAAKSTITAVNGELHQVMEGNGVTCKRTFVHA